MFIYKIHHVNLTYDQHTESGATSLSLTYLYHPHNFLFILKRRQVMEIVPPVEKETLTNEFEPWSEGERLVLEHLSKFTCRHVPRTFDFIRIYVQIHVLLREQYVIDYGQLCDPTSNSLSCSPQTPLLGAM